MKKLLLISAVVMSVFCLSISVRADILTMGNDHLTDFSAGGQPGDPLLPIGAYSRWNAFLNTDLGPQVGTEVAYGVMVWRWERQTGDTKSYIISSIHQLNRRDIHDVSSHFHVLKIFLLHLIRVV